jgi:HEAT repeat protein
MEQPQHKQEPTSPTVSETVSDEFTDQVAADFTGELPVPVMPMAEITEEVVLEEEKVKDEIEIQIDLLKDSDWVVRREAAITLGEMGDERCVAPLCSALRDGDWQVREVAIGVRPDRFSFRRTVDQVASGLGCPKVCDYGAG